MPMPSPTSLSETACNVLNAADPAAKVSLSAVYANEWIAGELSENLSHYYCIVINPELR